MPLAHMVPVAWSTVRPMLVTLFRRIAVSNFPYHPRNRPLPTKANVGGAGHLLRGARLLRFERPSCPLPSTWGR
eukprot:592573-Prorocentrum_minimum.AAC.1